MSHRHPRVRNHRLGAGRETPFSETRRRGLRHAVVRSPGVAFARRAQACPPPPGPCPCPGRRHFCPPLPPACAEPCPPRLVPSSLDTCPPHPCQGFREPSRPLPCLHLMATTMPMTSAASKPRWTRFLRMTGRGPPSPRCRRPHLPERAEVGREGRRTPVAPGITQLLGQVPLHRHPLLSSAAAAGWERPRRGFPGAEAAAK